MKKIVLPLLTLLFLISASFADEDRGKVVGRIQGSADVLDEIMAAPDKGIPEEIMGSAECVAVVPSMLKGGFVIGGEYGRGVATCRTTNGWSAPAFFRLGGGSFGLQIGGQAVDLVMLIMNQHGMQSLLTSHFKLGADASAAAGPVGRHAEGMTDWKMRAEVLTYSRARGLFAGVSLNGAVIKQDDGDTREFYGRMIPLRRILTGEIEAPKDSQPFLAAVAKYNAISTGTEAKAPAAATPAAPAPSTTAAPTTNATSAPTSAPATSAEPVAAAPTTTTPSTSATPPADAQKPATTATTSSPEKPSPAIEPHH